MRISKDTPRADDRWYGVSVNNDTILHQIYASFRNEYIPFLTELSKAYQVGEVASDIDDTVLMVHDVMKKIVEIITIGKVGKKDASILYQSINDIEANKSRLMNRITEDEEFRSKVEEIYETTGISAKDLGITKEMLKAGVKQVKGKQVDNEFQSGLEQKHPKSSGKLKSVVEGMKVAGLGPFAPVLDTVGDVENWLRSKLIKPKEKRGQSMPGSSMGGLPSRDRRFQQQTLPAPQPVERVSPGINYTEGESNSLFHFFNTRAYKAKWTKELLERMGGGKGTEPSSSGQLLKYAVSMAAVVGGIAFTIKKIYDLIKAIKEAKVSGGKAIVSAQGLGKVIAVRDAEIMGRPGGLEAASKKYNKTKKQLVEEATNREYTRQVGVAVGFAARENIVTRMEPWLVGKITGYKRPKVESKEQIRKDTERKFGYKPAKIDTAELDRIVKAAAEEMKKMGKSVDKLSDNVGKTQTEVKPVSVGNPFDSADPWVTQLSTGKLTVGGR